MVRRFLFKDSSAHFHIGQCVISGKDFTAKMITDVISGVEILLNSSLIFEDKL